MQKQHFSCEMGKFRSLIKELPYFPVYGHGIASSLLGQSAKLLKLKGYRTLEDVVEEAREKTGKEQVSLIGHSYGGLSVLVYTLENPLSVNDCVMIGAPINGTNRAYAAKLIPFKSFRQMLPGNAFVKAVQEYFKTHTNEVSNVSFTNYIAADDLFVPVKDASIKYLAEAEGNVTEFILENEGHGTLAHCKEVREKIIDLLESSESPIVFLHGFAMDKSFFKKVIKKIKKERPGLMQREKARLFHFTYDFTVPLEARKIKEWYNYRYDNEILQKDLLSSF